MAYRIKHGDVTVEADSLDEAAALTERLGGSTMPYKPPKNQLVPDSKSWESWHACGNPIANGKFVEDVEPAVGQIWDANSSFLERKRIEILKVLSETELKIRDLDDHDDGRPLQMQKQTLLWNYHLHKAGEITLDTKVPVSALRLTPVKPGEVWEATDPATDHRHVVVLDILSNSLFEVREFKKDGDHNTPIYRLSKSNLLQRYRCLSVEEIDALSKPSLQLAPEKKPTGSYYKKEPVTVGKRAASCGVRRGQFWKSKKTNVIAEITGIFDSTQDGKIYEKVQVRYVSGDTNRRNWSMRVTSLIAKYMCCNTPKKPYTPKAKPKAKKTPVKKVDPRNIANGVAKTYKPIFDPKNTGKGYSKNPVMWLEGPVKGKVKIANLDGRNIRWVSTSTLKRKYVPRVN